MYEAVIQLTVPSKAGFRQEREAAFRGANTCVDINRDANEGKRTWMYVSEVRLHKLNKDDILTPSHNNLFFFHILKIF